MSFTIEFVSPEDVLYSGVGTQVIARTRGGGEIAFLTGHEPFIGSLEPSEVRVTEESGDVLSFAVRSGFVSVTGDSVTVLSDQAMASSDIDGSVAAADLSAAQEALRANEHDAFALEDQRWAQLRVDLSSGSAA